MSSPLVLWPLLTSGFDLGLMMFMCSLFSESFTDGLDLPLVSSWSIYQCSLAYCGTDMDWGPPSIAI